MAYVVVLVGAFLIVSAATALRPSRRGVFAPLAFPVGWAAGELAGQALAVQAGLLALLAWWGWPSDLWLSTLVLVVAGAVVLENLALVGVLFHARVIVRDALANAPARPLATPRARDDVFGSWWRTALQFSWHPRSMVLDRDVAYGPLPRHRLDVWRASTTPEGAPVVFYVHGGSWTFGDKRQQARPMLHEFVARGWVVVAINYRLAPQDPWPAQMEDVARALAWVKGHVPAYGGDPDRVVVSGASAGGQLAALLAFSADDPTWRPRDVADEVDWHVRGAMTFYGVLEMTGDESLWRGLGRGLLVLLEGKVVRRPYVGNESIYKALSPFDRITVDAPPFLVVQGVTDTLVDVNVARAFAERFRRIAFAPLYYVELPFTQHSFDLAASPRTSATTRAAVAFAESVVRPRPPITAALIAHYQVPPATLFVEVASGDWRGADDAVAALGPFVVVTSDNPFSERLSDDENDARRAELRRALSARGVSFVASRGGDFAGQWPEEHGVAVLGLSAEEARALTRSWDQVAYYEVTRDGVVVREAFRDEVTR